MIEIRTIQYAEAGRFLSLLCDVFELDCARANSVFYAEPFFDLSRKWALFDGGEMMSILTTTPLQFGWGPAIGIAGVATSRGHRGAGYAGKLLERALAHYESTGERAAMLFAWRCDLYARYGFEQTDVVVRGRLESFGQSRPSRQLGMEEVRAIYDRWASAEPGRLLRDDRRWKLWNWTLRTCEQFRDGYVCAEGATVREALFTSSEGPFDWGTERHWLGLETMRKSLGIQIAEGVSELKLMTRGFPEHPQMFMTDQF